MALTPFFADSFFSAPSLFPSFFRDFDTHWGAHAAPQVSAHQTADAVHLEFEVPRYRPEDIKVTTDAAAGVVTVAGDRGGAQAHGRHVEHGSGSRVSSFERSFSLSPALFDLTQVKFALENGVLTVTIPRKPEEKPPASAVAAAPATDLAVTGELKKHHGESLAPAAVMAQWPPHLVASQTSAATVYTCALPDGIGSDNVHIKVADDRIQLSLEYKAKRQTKNSQTVHSASYTTTMPLPKGATKDSVSATFHDGKLEITVKHPAPAAAGSAPQNVPIQS